MFKLESGNEYRWLNKAAEELSNGSLQVGGVQPKISWTAFHIEDKSGTQKTAPERYDTINSILPSINHKVNTVDFQYHVMLLNMRYTKYLNPSQTAVSCSDQPLYALKKVIQWSYPEIFPEKDFFAFLGPMHIEQAALSAHGQLIRGTRLDTIIDNSVLTTIGLETSLCDANSIKKARYTIQVVSCVLYNCII